MHGYLLGDSVRATLYPAGTQITGSFAEFHESLLQACDDGYAVPPDETTQREVSEIIRCRSHGSGTEGRHLRRPPTG
ncbi:hypothetical protein T10_11779 [Trichinella papuae]|uniref:Uncharacterized protein n=1 Tax=Trichinella papuae TaxID=268474 RepID=A0A0V1N7L6_9BILA|nr:hypothetical protein T10_11779 [Trichinella papuae]